MESKNLLLLRGGVTVALALFMCSIYAVEIKKTSNLLQFTGLYDHMAYNRFFECCNSVVTGIDIQFRRKENTDIYVINAVTKEKKKVYSIPSEQIVPGLLHYYSLGSIKVEFHEFIAIDGNLYYGTSDELEDVPGAEFIQDDGNWSKINEKLSFAYNLYYFYPDENTIRASFSIMSNSIGTDNYVTRINRHYIQRMQDTMGMTLYSRMTKGGATVIYDLKEGGNSLTSIQRMSSLHSSKGEQPDYIFIAGGINDFLNNETWGTGYIRSAEIGNWVDDFSLLRNDGTFYEAYQFLIVNLKNQYPNSRIVCLTPMKTYTTKGCSSHEPFINNYGINLLDFVNAIKDICGRLNVDVIDMYSLFPITNENKYQLTVDCLHPNDVGYSYIESAIYEFLHQQLSNSIELPKITSKNNKTKFDLGGRAINQKNSPIYIQNNRKYINSKR